MSGLGRALGVLLSGGLEGRAQKKMTELELQRRKEELELAERLARRRGRSQAKVRGRQQRKTNTQAAELESALRIALENIRAQSGLTETQIKEAGDIAIAELREKGRTKRGRKQERGRNERGRLDRESREGIAAAGRASDESLFGQRQESTQIDDRRLLLMGEADRIMKFLDSKKHSVDEASRRSVEIASTRLREVFKELERMSGEISGESESTGSNLEDIAASIPGLVINQ